MCSSGCVTHRMKPGQRLVVTGTGESALGIPPSPGPPGTCVGPAGWGLWWHRGWGALQGSMLERVTQCVCPVGSISALLLLIIVHKKSFLIPGLPFGPWHNWVASSLIPVNDTQGVGEVSVLHRTLNQNKYVKRGSCGPCFCGQFVAQPSLFVRQVAGMVSHDEGDNTSVLLDQTLHRARPHTISSHFQQLLWGGQADSTSPFYRWTNSCSDTTWLAQGHTAGEHLLPSSPHPAYLRADPVSP